MRTIRKSKEKNNISFSMGKYWRVYVLVFSVFLIAILIILRLFYLQSYSHELYKALADNQHNATVEIEAQRGEIFLKDENDLYPIAVNRQFQMAFLAPKEVENEDEVIDQVSQILGLEKDEIKKKLFDRDDPFEVLKKKLSEEEAQKIKNLKLKGVHMMPEIYRYYPGGELASQVIGFVGSTGEEIEGVYGVESYWEENLKGESGMLTQERDASGRWISVSDREVRPAENGSNIVLTINHNVQYEVERILQESVKKHDADHGSIVVMNPKNGNILAMANSPTFDSNEFSKVEDPALFNNLAVNLPYEPGSIFKPFTMAIGIDDGKVNPSTTYIDKGSVMEAGYEIKNSDEKSYGKQTMTQVLEKSLNTGMIFVQKEVGNANFAEYIQRFGFGKRTNIDLPAESGGNIGNLEYLNRSINFYTAAFGQGITATPLQIANAYCVLANGGTLMKPQIIDSIMHQGQAIKIEPEEINRVISEDTSKMISEMLRSVVLNGHGKRADVPGYRVSGKTGTAQVAKVGSAGYEEDITVGSFAGYAPTDDPQFVVVVKIYHPKDVIWAESTAAPAFSKVMKFLLEYYQVSPTENPKDSPNWETYAEGESKENIQSQSEESDLEKKEDKKKKKKKD